jgi:hypothetical protein
MSAQKGARSCAEFHKEALANVAIIVQLKRQASVQECATQLKVVDYKIAVARGTGRITCAATAIADIRDMSA